MGSHQIKQLAIRFRLSQAVGRDDMGRRIERSLDGYLQLCWTKRASRTSRSSRSMSAIPQFAYAGLDERELFLDESDIHHATGRRRYSCR